MTQDEFVELHGTEAWERLVKPAQDAARTSARETKCDRCTVHACHANTLADCDVRMVLKLLGLKSGGILEAKKEING